MNKKDLIVYRFGDSNIVTDRELRLIAKSMTFLSLEIIDKITKDVIFASSEYGYAWHFPLKYIQDKKSMIFLSPHLLKMSKKKATHIILHEIGHFILKHKSPIYDNLNQKEIKKQEKEADIFANGFIAKDKKE